LGLVAKISLSSRDIALITVFGALSAFPTWFTNIINLVAITRIPGTNGIYVHFIVALIMWVGIGSVGKFGSATAISTVKSFVALIFMGGPGIVKFFLVPLNFSFGFITDLMFLRSVSKYYRIIACLFGIFQGLQIVIVQIFFGIPIAIGLPIILLSSISGAVGANFGVDILNKLRRNGVI